MDLMPRLRRRPGHEARCQTTAGKTAKAQPAQIADHGNGRVQRCTRAQHQGRCKASSDHADREATDPQHGMPECRKRRVPESQHQEHTREKGEQSESAMAREKRGPRSV